MSDYFVGSIVLWPGTYVPLGWKLCDGSVLSINDYQLLYALIGNTYQGGDGQTTFALPNLVGKFVRGTSGSAPALALGTAGGASTAQATGTVSLTADNLPEHDHPNSTISLGTLTATTQVKISTQPTGGSTVPAESSMLSSTTAGQAPAAAIYLPAAASLTGPGNLGGVSTTYSGAPTVTVDPAVTGNASTTAMAFSGPAPTQPPSLNLSYIICVQGIFPSSN